MQRKKRRADKRNTDEQRAPARLPLRADEQARKPCACNPRKHPIGTASRVPAPHGREPSAKLRAPLAGVGDHRVGYACQTGDPGRNGSLGIEQRVEPVDDLTVTDLEGEEIFDASLRIANDKWRLGQKEKDNGVLPVPAGYNQSKQVGKNLIRQQRPKIIGALTGLFALIALL